MELDYTNYELFIVILETPSKINYKQPINSS